MPTDAQVVMQGEFKDPMPGQIVYVRPQIPTVPIPPYRGKTYEDTVPDTYDVAESAKLAINGLTAPTNPKADHEIYFFVDFARNPVVMQHDYSDWCGLKSMEALPLVRLMTGSTLNDSVDRVWTDVVLKSIGPDGLFYIPLEGRPWGRTRSAWVDNGIARADGTFTTFDDPTFTQFGYPLSCGKSISIMMHYYLRDGNPIWKEACQRMIDRLLELAVHKEDYCYFPAVGYEPNAKLDPKSPQASKPSGVMGGEGNGRLMGPAARFYKLTGYEPARRLAEKQVRFMRFHDEYFGPNGEFLKERHFHAHTIYLLGMLELATATGDKELLEFIHKSYKWSLGSESGSSSLIGFFPEYARPDCTVCETCEVADMISLALKLSEAGVGDYYDEAERWTRNQFAEHQLTECDWVYRLSEKMNISPTPVKSDETADRTPERNLGAFAGWASANDWWPNIRAGITYAIQHCCTGNAARAQYDIWKHTLDYRDGRLRLNLLLNRASPWADVYSYVPYQGQVDLKIKQSCKSVLVRAPEWIESGSAQLAATIEDEPRAVRWEGRYIDLGAVEAGQTMQIKFPISERTVKETIGTVPYTLIVKGNTVVAIDPPGKNYPLYQRDHYRRNKVRWQKVTRFVSDENPDY